MMNTGTPDPVEAAEFYTGLVADLYEPLASERPRGEDYVRFLEHGGTPALELGCGSGRPLLDLVAMGFDVEGLDASADMLARCGNSAARRGLDVTLHHGLMQNFSLSRRYRSIFLAGPSFTLLVSDQDAQRALSCMRSHLEPDGSVLIPLELPDVPALRAAIGHRRTAQEGDAELVFSLTDVVEAPDGQSMSCVLRYERRAPGAPPEILERSWHRRFWSQTQFRTLMEQVGFTNVRFVAADGGRAADDASQFVVLATR